jgi:hypothetical protein
MDSTNAKMLDVLIGMVKLNIQHPSSQDQRGSPQPSNRTKNAACGVGVKGGEHEKETRTSRDVPVQNGCSGRSNNANLVGIDAVTISDDDITEAREVRFDVPKWTNKVKAPMAAFDCGRVLDEMSSEKAFNASLKRSADEVMVITYNRLHSQKFLYQFYTNGSQS